jgi:hypothetical protein
MVMASVELHWPQKLIANSNNDKNVRMQMKFMIIILFVLHECVHAVTMLIMPNAQAGIIFQ